MRNKEIKTGIIISIIIALFFWGFNFLKGKDIFKITDDYYVFYDDVSGLQESNSVYLNGYRVGRVSDITLDPEKPQHILVKITVPSGMKIPVNTIARISSFDILGTKAIELIISNSPHYYHDRDTLNGEAEKSITQQIEPVRNELMTVSNKIETLINSLNATFDMKMINDLRATAEALKKMTTNLSTGSESMTATVHNFEVITDNLRKNNDQITSILNHLSTLSDSLSNTEFKTAVVNLNNTLSKSNMILDKIDNGKGSLGKLVNDDSLYIHLNNVANSITRLSDDIQANPKKYVHFSVFGKKK